MVTGKEDAVGAVGAEEVTEEGAVEEGAVEVDASNGVGIKSRETPAPGNCLTTYWYKTYALLP